MVQQSIYCSTIIIFILITICNGHMYLSSVKINGQALGVGDCVRLTGTNNPIPLVTSSVCFFYSLFPSSLSLFPLSVLSSLPLSLPLTVF